MAKLNAEVSQLEVQAAIDKCSRNTAPGPDGIPYEVLKSLPESAVAELAALYTQILRTHTMPPAWKKGVVSMLYKKDDTEDCSNYRGLTLLDTMGKVFERVLLHRLAPFIERNGLLHTNQNAFRKWRGTEEHCFSLMQTINYNPDCLAAFVDIRKAYPTVFREGLFAKLAQCGVIGDIWSTMRNMYDGLSSAVSIEGTSSDTYAVENGLMEGAILSPFLYTIFVDGLARRLEAAKLGCKVGGAWAGALYYADDLVLLAKTKAEMQKMLYVLDQYCRDWRFQPSYAKTAVLRFGKAQSEFCGENDTPQGSCDCEGPNGGQKDCRLYLPCMYHTTPETARPPNSTDKGPKSKSNPILHQTEYEYLGIIFTDDMSFEQHVKRNVVPSINKARAQLYPYNATSKGLDTGTCAMLVRCLVESQLRYGAPLWAPPPPDVPGAKARKWNATQSTTHKVRKAHTTAVRTALGASRRTLREALFTTAGLYSTQPVWNMAVLQLWDRLRRLPDTRLGKAALKAAARDPANSFTKKVNAAHTAVFGHPPGSLAGAAADGKHRFKSNLKSAQWAAQRAVWHAHVAKHKDNGAHFYVSMPEPAFSGFLALKKHGQYSDKDVSVLLNLRMHSHTLATVLGAQATPAIPLDERNCSYCSSQAVPVQLQEDEVHFLLKCPRYEEERATMLEKLAEAYPQFNRQWQVFNDTQRARRLLWEIPDGTVPLWHGPGLTHATARVQATQAVLRYLGMAAKKHPTLRNMQYDKACHA